MHWILPGQGFSLPGKDTLILSEKLYTFYQTHENRPLCRHAPEGAIFLVERVRKLGAKISVELAVGQDVFGQHT